MVNEAVKVTFERIVDWMRGEENSRIDDWLTAEDDSFKGVISVINNCAANGWISSQDPMFKFADTETIKQATVLYEKANLFFGGAHS